MHFEGRLKHCSHYMHDFFSRETRQGADHTQRQQQDISQIYMGFPFKLE